MTPPPATSPLTGVPDRAERERTLADYLPAHHRLAARFHAAPDPDALARLAAWYTPPPDARGAVLLDDALFLIDMVRCLRPARLVELGAASGVSTAVLLKAMHTAHGDSAWRLDSYDLFSHCYWDGSLPVGYAARLMAPDLADRVELHAPGVAADVARDFSAAPGGLPLVFIDACHQHPYPVADLLALMPALAPGAWAVLHDINLPARAAAYSARTGESVSWGERGAKLLFDHWPHEKLAGGGTLPNIGAIRLPERLRGRDFNPAPLLPLINEPWETEPDAATRAFLDDIRKPRLITRVLRLARVSRW